MALVFVASLLKTPKELLENYNIFIHKLIIFLPEITERLKKQNIDTNYTYIDGYNVAGALRVSMQSLNVAFFKPNIFFVMATMDETQFSVYEDLISIAKQLI